MVALKRGCSTRERTLTVATNNLLPESGYVDDHGDVESYVDGFAVGRRRRFELLDSRFVAQHGRRAVPDVLDVPDAVYRSWTRAARSSGGTSRRGLTLTATGSGSTFGTL